MSDSVTIHVEGLATIDAALRALPEAMQEEILADALGAAADVMKRGIASRVHDRTGKTDADLTVEVEVRGEATAGRAQIGGTVKGGGSREHVLRFLEFGTKPHPIPRARTRLRRAERARGMTLASLNAKKGPMAFGGRVFSRIKHPGIQAQAPMRRTLLEDGPTAVAAFARRAWDGIVATVEDKAHG